MGGLSGCWDSDFTANFNQCDESRRDRCALRIGRWRLLGAYVIAGKKAGRQHGQKAPALGLIVASILVFPIGIEKLSFSIIDWNVIMLIALIALLSSVIPLILEMKALRHLPTKTYGVLTSGEPVVGAAVGFFMLGEQLTTLQLLGLATIVIASIGTVTSPIPNIKRVNNKKAMGVTMTK
ncbi:EamA family transporter [Shewanella psychropiezotolerans]|uniref:EamA family transporter n=1 Tax=Shewanella psychropiezotolerans TaxID=2593655 RepID=A0ABX5WX26_9GAMM|nr:EamA family transporter [Shewanella psychropiezotolerans]